MPTLPAIPDLHARLPTPRLQAAEALGGEQAAAVCSFACHAVAVLAPDDQLRKMAVQLLLVSHAHAGGRACVGAGAAGTGCARSAQPQLPAPHRLRIHPRRPCSARAQAVLPRCGIQEAGGALCRMPLAPLRSVGEAMLEHPDRQLLLERLGQAASHVRAVEAKGSAVLAVGLCSLAPAAVARCCCLPCLPPLCALALISAARVSDLPPCPGPSTGAAALHGQPL